MLELDGDYWMSGLRMKRGFGSGGGGGGGGETYA